MPLQHLLGLPRNDLKPLSPQQKTEPKKKPSLRKLVSQQVITDSSIKDETEKLPEDKISQLKIDVPIEKPVSILKAKGPKKKQKKHIYIFPQPEPIEYESSDWDQEKLDDVQIGLDLGIRHNKVMHSTYCKDYSSKPLKGLDSKKAANSVRLFAANQFHEKRLNLPLIIVNLDGFFGSWDYQKEVYVLRQKMLDSLITLSYDFMLIAVSHQKSKYIKRLVQQLQKIPIAENLSVYPPQYSYKQVIFDAVYQIKQKLRNSRHLNFDNLQINEDDKPQNDLS